MSDIEEIHFIPAYSTKVEAVSRATMSGSDDEAVKDRAADEAERSQFDGSAVDIKVRLRDKQADRREAS